MRLFSRKSVRIALLALVVVALVGGIGGARGFRYVKTDPQFCRSCHLMEHAFERWETSVHKNVVCQTCHRADLFEEARLGYAAFIQQKDAIGPHTKLDHKICQECHLSNDAQWKQVAATPGHRVHVVDRGVGCLECHVTELHVFEADTRQCQRCHGKDKLKLDGMQKLSCLGCHDFAGHQSHHESLIPTAQDCRRCHAASADIAPPVANTPFARFQGRVVITPKGHEDCLGCHRPHGARIDVPIDCLKCHRNLLESGPHHKDERLMECGACHEPHEPKER